MLNFKSLLTINNAKIAKSNASGKGYFSSLLHLAPYNLSGHQVCPQASQGCAAACLNTAGHGAFNTVQQARIARTKYFFENRTDFMRLLKEDISRFVRKCDKLKLKAAVRLNGTSDLKWEELAKDLFIEFKDVQFYDYTKITKRMIRFCNGGLPSNYHLTFSRSENNQAAVDEVLKAGGNVAVVFHKKLPKKWNGVRVIDADKTDQRFLDPKGVICGLTSKGRGRKDSSGFVILSN